jgi:hypothetical protein
LLSPVTINNNDDIGIFFSLFLIRYLESYIRKKPLQWIKAKMELLSLGYLPLKFAIKTSNTVDGKTPVQIGDVITGRPIFTLPQHSQLAKSNVMFY